MKNSTLLPQHINLLSLAELAENFSGSLLIKDMPRLLLSLYGEQGEVDVDLGLDTDKDGTRLCRVQLKTAIHLQCQRCMNPFTYEIISDFVQGIVSSASEAEALPEYYEPVIAEDGLLIIKDMVEDELILSLPIVPMHPADECEVKLPLTNAGPDEVKEKQNPFYVLRTVKPETNK